MFSSFIFTAPCEVLNLLSSTVEVSLCMFLSSESLWVQMGLFFLWRCLMQELCVAVSSDSKICLINESCSSLCLLGWLSPIFKINWLNYYHWLSALSHNPHKSILDSVSWSGSLIYWHFINLGLGATDFSLWWKWRLWFQVTTSCLADIWPLTRMSCLK